MPDSKIPGNWAAFLRIDKNKEELFHFFADQLGTVGVQHGQVVSTKGNAVVCNRETDDTSSLSPCNREEADTRLLLHAADAAKNGLKKIMLRTVDTDVVVIAVSTFRDLGLSELWIAFGVGKHFCYIAAHEIASTLGQHKSRALLAFHAFTGCDQTSSFKHIGKKTAWDAWSVYDEVTEVFRCLSSPPPSIEALTNMLSLY